MIGKIVRKTKLPVNFIIAFVVSSLVITSALYHLHTEIKIQRDIARMKIEIANIEKSVNNFDYLLQPLINDFGASRVAVFKLKLNPGSKTFDIFGTQIENIKTITRREQDTPSPLLNIRPLSFYSEMLPTLVEHKPVVLYVKDMPTSAFKEILEARKTVFAVWVDISDSEGNFIGLMSAGWTKTDYIPQGEELDHLLKNMKYISDNLGTNLELTSR